MYLGELGAPYNKSFQSGWRIQMWCIKDGFGQMEQGLDTNKAYINNPIAKT
jgi:hypothetical protein